MRPSRRSLHRVRPDFGAYRNTSYLGPTTWSEAYSDGHRHRKVVNRRTVKPLDPGPMKGSALSLAYSRAMDPDVASGAPPMPTSAPISKYHTWQPPRALIISDDALAKQRARFFKHLSSAQASRRRARPRLGLDALLEYTAAGLLPNYPMYVAAMQHGLTCGSADAVIDVLALMERQGVYPDHACIVLALEAGAKAIADAAAAYQQALKEDKHSVVVVDTLRGADANSNALVGANGAAVSGGFTDLKAQRPDAGAAAATPAGAAKALLEATIPASYEGGKAVPRSVAAASAAFRDAVVWTTSLWNRYGHEFVFLPSNVRGIEGADTAGTAVRDGTGNASDSAALVISRLPHPQSSSLFRSRAEGDSAVAEDMLDPRPLPAVSDVESRAEYYKVVAERYAKQRDVNTDLPTRNRWCVARDAYAALAAALAAAGDIGALSDVLDVVDSALTSTPTAAVNGAVGVGRASSRKGGKTSRSVKGLGSTDESGGVDSVPLPTWAEGVAADATALLPRGEYGDTNALTTQPTQWGFHSASAAVSALFEGSSKGPEAFRAAKLESNAAALVRVYGRVARVVLPAGECSIPDGHPAAAKGSEVDGEDGVLTWLAGRLEKAKEAAAKAGVASRRPAAISDGSEWTPSKPVSSWAIFEHTKTAIEAGETAVHEADRQLVYKVPTRKDVGMPEFTPIPWWLQGVAEPLQQDFRRPMKYFPLVFWPSEQVRQLSETPYAYGVDYLPSEDFSVAVSDPAQWNADRVPSSVRMSRRAETFMPPPAHHRDSIAALAQAPRRDAAVRWLAWQSRRKASGAAGDGAGGASEGKEGGGDGEGAGADGYDEFVAATHVKPRSSLDTMDPVPPAFLLNTVDEMPVGTYEGKVVNATEVRRLMGVYQNHPPDVLWLSTHWKDVTHDALGGEPLWAKIFPPAALRSSATAAIQAATARGYIASEDAYVRAPLTDTYKSTQATRGKRERGVGGEHDGDDSLTAPSRRDVEGSLATAVAAPLMGADAYPNLMDVDRTAAEGKGVTFKPPYAFATEAPVADIIGDVRVWPHVRSSWTLLRGSLHTSTGAVVEGATVRAPADSDAVRRSGGPPLRLLLKKGSLTHHASGTVAAEAAATAGLARARLARGVAPARLEKMLRTGGFPVDAEGLEVLIQAYADVADADAEENFGGERGEAVFDAVVRLVAEVDAAGLGRMLPLSLHAAVCEALYRSDALTRTDGEASAFAWWTDRVEFSFSPRYAAASYWALREVTEREPNAVLARERVARIVQSFVGVNAPVPEEVAAVVDSARWRGVSTQLTRTPTEALSEYFRVRARRTRGFGNEMADEMRYTWYGGAPAHDQRSRTWTHEMRPRDARFAFQMDGRLHDAGSALNESPLLPLSAPTRIDYGQQCDEHST